MSKYIMAIDQGTTGTTVMIFDRNGGLISSGYKEIQQYYPKPGWVEHNPDEIWQTTSDVIEQTLKKGRIKSNQIAAIGITNQRETTVLWDKTTGRAVHPAIVWQCRRTSEICQQLKKKGLEEIFRSKTGLVIDPYFSGTKIKWLFDNIRGLRAKAKSGKILFGTIDTWLIWKLTGGKVHVTDFTNASRTLIFNIKTKRWDAELLKILEIPQTILPNVKPSSSIFGKTAKISAIADGIPIAAVAGDQQAALFGQGCFLPGEIKNTYGTGCFLVMNTGDKFVKSRRGLLTTLACDGTGRPVYALEGSIFIAGAAVQWLRDGLKLIEGSAETEKWASSVFDNNGVYFVPAFAGLGAPYWEPEARGVICGLTRGATSAHIIRATLEAIAYQTRDVVEVMRGEANKDITLLKVDGKACRNNFLMQFQADILNRKIVRPKMVDSTAKGAAFLAGLAVGFWKGPSELKNMQKIDKIFYPKMPASKRERLYKGWLEAIKRTRHVR